MSDITSALADPGNSGVYRVTRDPLAIERDAKAARLAVYRIDLWNVRDKSGFMARVSTALRFPEYFGKNLDALHDCLTDLAWLADGDKPRSGLVLVFEHVQDFAGGHPQDFEDCLAVLLSAAEYWRGTGAPFWVLLHSSGEWEPRLPEWPPH